MYLLLSMAAGEGHSKSVVLKKKVTSDRHEVDAQAGGPKKGQSLWTTNAIHTS